MAGGGSICSVCAAARQTDKDSRKGLGGPQLLGVSVRAGSGTRCVCWPLSPHLRLLALWPHQQLQFHGSVQPAKPTTQDAHTW
jgi:hypothetical protein